MIQLTTNGENAPACIIQGEILEAKITLTILHPFLRCYVSVVMHDNKIYAMGGYNGRMRMSSAERYDPESNQWELIKPMQRQRSDASAAVLNDKVSFNKLETNSKLLPICLDLYCWWF